MIAKQQTTAIPIQNGICLLLILNFSHTSLVHFIMFDVKGRHNIVMVGRREKAQGISYSSIYTLSYSLLFDFSMLGTTLSK